MYAQFAAVVLFALTVPRVSTKRCENTQFECFNGYECIPKSSWCHSGNLYRCSDNSHLKNCGGRYDCYRSQKPCTDGKCIPYEWLCDGHRDCDDFSDEQNCRHLTLHRISSVSGISSARQRTLHWILSQRRINWGWENDTNRAIVSLYLANAKQFVSRDANYELMAKQLKIQLSKLLLLKSGADSIPAHQLALYIHALLVTCVNPKSFPGYNLVEILRKQKIEKSDSLNPFLILALCNANETISPIHIEELMEIMKRPNKPETIDSKAYAAMALFCIKRQTDNPPITISLRGENHNIKVFSRPGYIRVGIPFNDTWKGFDANVTAVFKGLQHQSGSFGSVYTTALALQALITSESMEGSWNLTKGIQYLLSQQRSDGSFGSMLSTYLVLPLLHARTLFDLGTSSCLSSQYRNMTVKEEFDSIPSSKRRLQYSIWMGDHKDVSFSISLMVPIKKTFYDVMRLAAELDPRYRFDYFQYSWGKYIYSIFGVVNDPEARMYWQLYHVEEENATTVDEAPDKFIPEDNGWYAYWYQPKDEN